MTGFCYPLRRNPDCQALAISSRELDIAICSLSVVRESRNNSYILNSRLHFWFGMSCSVASTALGRDRVRTGGLATPRLLPCLSHGEISIPSDAVDRGDVSVHYPVNLTPRDRALPTSLNGLTESWSGSTLYSEKRCGGVRVHQADSPAHEASPDTPIGWLAFDPRPSTGRTLDTPSRFETSRRSQTKYRPVDRPPTTWSSPKEKATTTPSLCASYVRRGTTRGSISTETTVGPS